ncbi:predicted protein [Chaetomium globosum CBS 148.51]|uniref:Uncharacterized protein n=1 Tax=Chaetomium globosum (strain ATCC 6205 / CBS 148.51 / DSM 1962 / NBRC 6347 / NRRL 1970) TaxID=306901 RepID=Q2H3Z4_CHAGB|nr:uncharacterized protein CHGG_06621 [Chaetomium globosum CBS 148.51]EAQ90002.1 predicted protein [Chaetomium globosum CBS 148.51]
MARGNRRIPGTRRLTRAAAAQRQRPEPVARRPGRPIGMDTARLGHLVTNRSPIIELVTVRPFEVGELGGDLLPPSRSGLCQPTLVLGEAGGLRDKEDLSRRCGGLVPRALWNVQLDRRPTTDDRRERMNDTGKGGTGSYGIESTLLCMVTFAAPIATWRDREPWLPFLRPTRWPRAGALEARLGFGVQSPRRDGNRETQSEAGDSAKILDRPLPVLREVPFTQHALVE